LGGGDFPPCGSQYVVYDGGDDDDDVGFLLRPPPGMTKVKVGKEDSSSAEFVERRRAALERYARRP